MLREKDRHHNLNMSSTERERERESEDVRICRRGGLGTERAGEVEEVWPWTESL